MVGPWIASLDREKLDSHNCHPTFLILVSNAAGVKKKSPKHPSISLGHARSRTFAWTDNDELGGSIMTTVLFRRKRGGRMRGTKWVPTAAPYGCRLQSLMQ